MTLWKKTLALPKEKQEHVLQIYDSSFPIDVRNILAPWIEDQPWKVIEEDNIQHIQYATQLFEEMIKMLENKMDKESDLFTKMKFNQLSLHIKNLYTSNPMNLVRVIKRCLSAEERLHEQNVKAPEQTTVKKKISKERETEIHQTISKIEAHTRGIEKDLTCYKEIQENHIILQDKKKQIEEVLNSGKLTQTDKITVNVKKMKKSEEHTDEYTEEHLKENEAAILKNGEHLWQMMQKVFRELQLSFESLKKLQKIVVEEELRKWKRDQQLSANGEKCELAYLNTIENWCMALAELIWQNWQHIKNWELLNQNLSIKGLAEELAKLNQSFQKSLSELINSTFIIVTQPRQVIKTDTKFIATLRLLVGGKLFKHMQLPQVMATIISEAQARTMSDSMQNRTKVGGILNNKGIMNYDEATGQLFVKLSNMKLTNFKREDKGEETVKEQKFAILFTSQIGIGASKDLLFQVMALSLPVVVIKNVSQEPDAWATICWDNAFAEVDRQPFVVPDTVPWPDVANILSCQFESATGKGLEVYQLNYLATKIFGGNTTDDFSQCKMTWSQFNKDHLPTTDFTFWEWFYSAKKLTIDHLAHHWANNAIIGFIDKQQTRKLLKSQQDGTFLIRFSGSKKGSITVSWIGEHYRIRDVYHVGLWTGKFLTVKTLADGLKDLTHLTYLLSDKHKDGNPDIKHKDEVFGKFYSSHEGNTKITSQDGYIPTHLIVYVEGQRSDNIDIDTMLDNNISPDLMDQLFPIDEDMSS